MSECWKEENGREEDWSGEIFGFHSRCFFSSLTREVCVNKNQSPVVPVEGRCYRHRCTGPNQYQIQVSGSDWLDCPAGGTVQITGYRGSVHCPDRRLCLYADVTPPSDDVTALPPIITSETSTGTQTGIRPPPRPPAGLSIIIIIISICIIIIIISSSIIIIVVCLLASRKCCLCKVGIHPEDHTDL